MKPDHSSRNQNNSNFMFHLPISMQTSIIIFVLDVNQKTIMIYIFRMKEH